jgi:hypothetical protein
VYRLQNAAYVTCQLTGQLIHHLTHHLIGHLARHLTYHLIYHLAGHLAGHLLIYAHADPKISHGVLCPALTSDIQIGNFQRILLNKVTPLFYRFAH